MKWFLSSGFLIASLIVFLVFNQSPISVVHAEESSREEAEAVQGQGQYVSSVPMPNSMTFCGDRVPLNRDDVREALDRELTVNTYYHSSTIQILKRASRYLPAIEKILSDQGLPDDLKFIAMAESGLISESVSGAGAKGIWQIMKGTGKEYGLECAIEVDERYHLEKSTKLASKFLRKAHAKFGNWATAAASYNAGMTAIQRQVDRQKQNDYYNLYLNTETGRYVYRVLALKEIYNNPERYGFHISDDQRYQPRPYTTVKVKSINSMADFAAEHGVTYKQIKLLNPWLRSFAMEPRRNGKVYEIKILSK